MQRLLSRATDWSILSFGEHAEPIVASKGSGFCCFRRHLIGLNCFDHTVLFFCPLNMMTLCSRQKNSTDLRAMGESSSPNHTAKFNGHVLFTLVESEVASRTDRLSDCFSSSLLKCYRDMSVQSNEINIDVVATDTLTWKRGQDASVGTWSLWIFRGIFGLNDLVEVEKFSVPPVDQILAPSFSLDLNDEPLEGRERLESVLCKNSFAIRKLQKKKQKKLTK